MQASSQEMCKRNFKNNIQHNKVYIYLAQKSWLCKWVKLIKKKRDLVCTGENDTITEGDFNLLDTK